jgi:hypothetical protein
VDNTVGENIYTPCTERFTLFLATAALNTVTGFEYLLPAFRTAPVKFQARENRLSRCSKLDPERSERKFSNTASIYSDIAPTPYS